MHRKGTLSALGILFSMLIIVLASGPALAQTPAMWTTLGACGDSPGISHFKAGDVIYLNGINFPEGYWNMSITGTPSSCDPGEVIAYVDIPVGADGRFCVAAYTVKDDDCGAYEAFKDGAYVTFYVDRNSRLDIVNIAAEARWEEAITWSIDKKASPEQINMFTGDQTEVGYEITLDKSVVNSDPVISGTVTVADSGAAPVGFSLTITLMLGSTTIDQTVITTLSSTGIYPFSFPLASPVAGTYAVQAVVTVTNGSGDSDSKSVDLIKEYTGYPTIHVTDGTHSWEFSDDGVASYATILNCDADEGVRTNIATITETGQADTADVDVNCYALEVSKTADPAFARSYTWSLKKTGDKTEDWITIPMPFDPTAPALTTTVNYAVAVDTAGYVDSDWNVFGEIRIYNPAPIPAVILSVADLITGGIAPAVNFSVTFPHTLAAGGTLSGTYSTSLPDGAGRTNTATATLVNYYFALSSPATEIGSTSFSGSAAFTFGAPATQIDECVQVSDNMAGALGNVCLADLPKTFTYSQNYGPMTDEDCGENYERTNTATLLTADTGTSLTSQWKVTIHVDCGEVEREPLEIKASCVDPFVFKPTILVHFVVTNPNSEPVEILHGLNNGIDPVSYQGMQPTLFAPGVTEWEIEIGRMEIINWLLDGSVATASMETNICDYARQDDVYIAGVGVFYDTNSNGQYDTGETMLAPDANGYIGEVYLFDADGNQIDSRTLGKELFFRSGRDVNFSMRQIWGDFYLVPRLNVSLPAGYKINPAYRLIHTSEFPEPFYSMNNDFGLVPVSSKVGQSDNADLPHSATMEEYLRNPVKPGVQEVFANVNPFAFVPASYGLQQNYPNPFNPQTTISYDLPEKSHVTLTVYNAMGAVVARLVVGQQEAGSYTQAWNGAQNPSGIYLYELRAGSFRQVKRMLLMK